MNDYRVKGIAPDMTLAGFLAALKAAQSPVSPTEALAVYAYAATRRVSQAWLLAVFNHESSMGKSGTATKTHSWGNTRRPSFGAVDIGEVAGRSGLFSLYPDWAAGGISTVARICDHAPYAKANTVQTITPIWAPPTDSNDTAAYIAAVLADIQRFKETSTMARIALASGHHNTDGGDPFEATQTGFLTAAVAKYCAALGMDVRIVTPGGGAGMFSGGIWDVAAAVVRLAQGGWVPDIFLETHTEGGGGTGVFAIYPDAAGDLDTDVRDKLGPDVAKRIAAATGLGIGGRQNGTMSEKQTRVGGQGFRLGIFNKTAPIAANTTRLIIEYGAHDKEPDLSIVKAPGFYDKAGKATAEAFAAFLGLPTQPGAGSVVEAPAPPAPADDTVIVTPFINAAGEPCVTLNYRGKAKQIVGVNIADAGMSVIGMDDATYDRSIRQNAGQPYTKRTA